VAMVSFAATPAVAQSTGVKSILGDASDNALDKLSQPGAFYADEAVRILLPGPLEKATSILRFTSKAGLTKDITKTLNDAAGRAALEAKPVFRSAIDGLTLQDGVGIVTGGNEAGSDYLRRTSGEELAAKVRPLVEKAFAEVNDVQVIVYEPTAKYQNVAKRNGVEKLTISRALIAEMVRRYSILGIECTLLEVQKLGYFLERFMELFGFENEFKFHFSANKYGPYSERLKHLLDSLDGSYLHCEKRLADASPFDQIRFDDAKKDKISAYLASPDVKKYRPVLEATTDLIDGLESPHGMELLSTVDWLVYRDSVEPNVNAVTAGLSQWICDKSASQRKLALFDERVIAIALETLASSPLSVVSHHIKSR